jgi:hypothetical protein
VQFTFLPNFKLIGLQILPPDGPLGNMLLHLSSYKQHYLTELITFSLSILTFSLSRTTVKVSHVASGEHMVPGPFHFCHQGQGRIKKLKIVETY